MSPSVSRRFDARRATGLLLLLTGSLAGGLTAYWFTPESRNGQGPVSPQEQAPAQASVATSVNEDARAAPDPWSAQESTGTVPRFSQQPAQTPQGWTRGS